MTIYRKGPSALIVRLRRLRRSAWLLIALSSAVQFVQGIYSQTAAQGATAAAVGLGE